MIHTFRVVLGIYAAAIIAMLAFAINNFPEFFILTIIGIVVCYFLGWITEIILRWSVGE